ncbi:tetratricopeptide repeat protein [Mariniflexile fucanivorans]|uniref:Tetratricopeptide repeat protein n=1 Tax=Mariniflexile fucanivorans TaxID=264023 RepID=A0A4R1RCM9_9FLAO|nr:tetratricopeptide repeat protein [Mariniflexile fucanivorans]TCL63573.1 tetratricopeptide repeat protein [Mariniflexile fucanivorans]
MKYILLIIIALTTTFSFSQDKEKEALLAAKKANNYVYDANNLISEDDFVSAEKEYRKAISEQGTTVAGIYNLGNSYIKKGSLDEAIYRLDQAAKIANSKTEKHKAYHNIGNVLMQNKKCKEAVEAYKSALRNDPTDNETRYNLGIAKICAEQQKDQQDQNKDDKDKDKKDDKQDQDKKEGDDKKDQDKKDEGDQDKKEGDDKKDDNGKPKDEKDDKGKEDDKENQQPPKPRPGQMSPQQVKNLLEAMNNQEQKVQEKVNAEKQKGVKVKTEKDW